MHIADSRDEEMAARLFEPFLAYFKNRKHVLDLGSGQGFFLKQLQDMGVTGAGVEVDQLLCQEARERGLENIHCTDIMTFLRETDEVFDGCFASHIVEHFAPDEVLEILRGLNTRMEAGGVVVIVTPNIANLRRAAGDFWRDPSHVRPYPVSALKRLLERTGWEVTGSGYHTGKPFSLGRTVRYFVRNLLIGRFWAKEDLFVVAVRR